MFKCLLLVGALLMPDLALAGGGGIITRGSGHGVRIDNHVYLADLYYADLHKNSDLMNKWITFRAKRRLGRHMYLEFPARLVNLVELKIAEISKMDLIVADAIYQAINILGWEFTNVELDRLPFRPASSDNIVQIAVRDKSKVIINRQIWIEMDTFSQVGLIIHEAVSALYRGRFSDQGLVRNFVAHLFSGSTILPGNLWGFPTEPWVKQTIGYMINDYLLNNIETYLPIFRGPLVQDLSYSFEDRTTLQLNPFFIMKSKVKSARPRLIIHKVSQLRSMLELTMRCQNGNHLRAPYSGIIPYQFDFKVFHLPDSVEDTEPMFLSVTEPLLHWGVALSVQSSLEYHANQSVVNGSCGENDPATSSAIYDWLATFKEK